MNIKNIKRWWANQCAQSATGLHLGELVSQYHAAMQHNRELLAENRRLASAHRAIIATHHDTHPSMAHWERMTHYDYSIATAALQVNAGRAEAATAPYAHKTKVAEVAESGRAAAKTGASAQTFYLNQYWRKRWTGSPDNIKGSLREYRATQRKAKLKSHN